MKSEEESRKIRNRGDSFNSVKSENDPMETKPPRGSVIEFLEDAANDQKSKITKRKSERKCSKKNIKPSNTSKDSSTYSFFIGDSQIHQSSLIFEALYKYELQSSANQDSNPNVWAKVYTITFKKNDLQNKIPSYKPNTRPISTSSSSDIIDEICPFLTFNKSSLDVDLDTTNILRLLGVLNELNVKAHEIFEWIDKTICDLGTLSFVSSRLFVNSKITAKMNRQLDEPLIVASHVLPTWCKYLSYEFPFILPYESRLIYLQSQSFGYSRNMARWQQMPSNSVSTQGGQNSILGRIQRQKIRISRNKILETMIKLMESFGSTQALLEIEFFDEVGTGLGPTLEFYSLVCQEVRKRSGILLNSTSGCSFVWRGDSSYSKESKICDASDYFNVMFPYPYYPHGNKYLYLNLIDRIVSGFFKSLGTLIAKALLDSRVLDIPFSPLFIQMCVFGHSSLPKMSAIRVIVNLLLMF